MRLICEKLVLKDPRFRLEPIKCNDRITQCLSLSRKKTKMEEESEGNLKSTNELPKIPTVLPWDRFSNWLHCACVVTFDLELGQAMEVCKYRFYPVNMHLLTFRRLLTFCIKVKTDHTDSLIPVLKSLGYSRLSFKCIRTNVYF